MFKFLNIENFENISGIMHQGYNFGYCKINLHVKITETLVPKEQHITQKQKNAYF